MSRSNPGKGKTRANTINHVRDSQGDNREVINLRSLAELGLLHHFHLTVYHRSHILH